MQKEGLCYKQQPSEEVSPEVTLYPAKKKKYGKTRRRDHTSTSRDSSSSDGNDLDNSQHTRFKIATENAKFKWKLPKGMANYANKYFEEFISEGDLKEAILMPVQCQKICTLLKNQTISLKIFLKKKGKVISKIQKIFLRNCEIKQDRSSQQMCSMKKGVLRYFSKFTGKYLCQSLFFNKVAGLRPFLQNTSGRLLLTRDVMGPQAKLRKILEDAKQAVDEAVQISVNELFLYMLSKQYYFQGKAVTP